VAAALAVTLRPIESLTARLGRDLDGVFAEVVSGFEEAVYTTALRISGVPGDAEDLAAETFLRAYSALRGYSPPRIEQLQLRPWLITICLNLWRNQVRTAARRPVSAFPAEEALSPGESPEDRVQRHDESDQLAAVLQQLPTAQRVAVVLRHVVGLSYAEVAEVLGCPEGTAKSHVRRGLDRLRTLLLVHQEVLP
jgi:RNA polymerase sigma factor (sigma-70 family)